MSQNKAAAGLLNSGAQVRALNAFATGEAQKYGQAYVDTLGALANRGAGAVNALTGAGQGYANAVSGDNNTAASAAGKADLTSANAFGGILGTALNAFNTVRGQTSYGGGGGFNAFAPGG